MPSHVSGMILGPVPVANDGVPLDAEGRLAGNKAENEGDGSLDMPAFEPHAELSCKDAELGDEGGSSAW